MMNNTIDKLGGISQKALNHFVYVIGTARGGTSIFRDALGIHENILMFPGETHFMNEAWRCRKRVPRRLLRRIIRLPWFFREIEVTKLLGETKGRLLRKYIEKALTSANLRLMWQIYPIVYSLDPDNKKRPDQILCWGDKANDFYRVRTVRRFFPKGKFIFITRDPRGAVSSLAKRMAIKEEHSRDSAINNTKLIEACIHWRNMAQRMAHFAKCYPNRTMMVRFEDFLNAPEKVLNKVFRFCANTSPPEDIITDRLKKLRYGTTNIPDERGSGISKGPIDRWKSFLNDKQLETIGELTGKTALKLGYEAKEFRFKFNFLKIVNRMPSTKRKAVAAAKLAYLQIFELFI
jgi:hypothetical protein